MYPYLLMISDRMMPDTPNIYSCRSFIDENFDTPYASGGMF